jgi:hypothetical protein
VAIRFRDLSWGDAMAHTSRCSNAQTDARSCRCSCGGSAHGGDGGLGLVASARAARVSPSSSRPLSRRTATVADSPGSIQDLTSQTVDMVSEQVADAIADKLHSNGYHWQENQHVLCVFLAACARAMQELEDQFDQAVTRVVRAVMTPRRGQQHRPIPEPVVRIAAQTAVDALSRLTAVQHFENVLRATRILAVMNCPSPQTHKAVARYCMGPLGREILSAATRQEMASALPKGWITVDPG